MLASECVDTCYRVNPFIEISLPFHLDLADVGVRQCVCVSNNMYNALSGHPFN